MSIFYFKKFSGGSYIPEPPLKGGWDGKEGKRLKKGEGCVIAFGGWTPLSIDRRLDYQKKISEWKYNYNVHVLSFSYAAISL
jgi:hypothetical protein